ncbi:IS1595 family transposase [Massilia sp. LC238]|uniref:IS1595 family transposase n=1 Tax=Massilia sp. LC238 TaxID=1502852 RepID=UPI0004E3E7CA|nr:IS1595 family transposase [Massilia sp. LC238]KFC61502.1 Transposase [Massilia sp. LC238]
MQAASFKSWLARNAQLTRRQREQLLALLRPAVGLDRACATIEEARSPSSCPVCDGRRLHRHGHVRGVQRYRCCACGKTFSALTGTPLARLRHRSKWLDYLDGILEGQSVRKTADRLGVHRNTSFRWRHRFLHLAKEDRPAALAGIAEADELFLLESRKGSRKLDRLPRKRAGVASRRGINSEHVCVLVARDRTGATFDFITGRGAVTTAQLHRYLLPVLDRDVLLVTDSHPAYNAFARTTAISHEAVNLLAGERVRGAVHVQNVNAYHRRFRQWLARFNGVASRYLPNYLGWQWAVDGRRIESAEAMLRIALGRFNIER